LSVDTQCCPLTHNVVRWHTMLSVDTQCCPLTHNVVRWHTMLQWHNVAVSMKSHSKGHCNTLQHTATVRWHTMLQWHNVAVSMKSHSKGHCNTLQHTATVRWHTMLQSLWNRTPRATATHCNTLQQSVDLQCCSLYDIALQGPRSGLLPYEMATISGLLKIIVLFCKRAL